MRLREINELLWEASGNLTYNISSRNSKPPTYSLSTATQLKYAVEVLNELGLFEDVLKKLRTQSFFNSVTPSIIIQHNEHAVLSQEIPNLKVLCDSLSDSIEKSIPKTTPEQISIKIPNPTSFKELKITADKLDKIFSNTILHSDIKGNVKISNFDTGSYWIDIIATGEKIIPLIAGLAWSAVVVFKKLQEGKLVQEKVKAMKISNGAFKEIVDKSKEQINQTAEIEANHLQQEFYKTKEPEQTERLKMSLKELAELYSKGARIYPSLEASEDTIKSFPDFEKLEYITTKIKKITSNK